MKTNAERRSYIRHASNAPVQVQAREQVHAADMDDVSDGGLAFRNELPLDVGRELKIAIPMIKPPFDAECVVRWCRATEDGDYEVGVMFSDPETVFRMRMVEQVCHIMEYRENCLAQGREISFEDAADEWIRQFAAGFGQ